MKKYIVPSIEEFRLNTPVLMLDVSKNDGKSDDSDSDKSRFWGSTIFDEEEEDDEPASLF